MKVQITTKLANTETNTPAETAIVSALLYAFPKKGNAPADYKLTANGMETKVAMTGGGKYPTYVYLVINGTSYYLPKNVTPVSGTDVAVVVEAPKPAPKAPKPAEKVEPAPKAPKPAEKVEPAPKAPTKPRRSKK